jgi:hypothetical protein
MKSLNKRYITNRSVMTTPVMIRLLIGLTQLVGGGGRRAGCTRFTPHFSGSFHFNQSDGQDI